MKRGRDPAGGRFTKATAVLLDWPGRPDILQAVSTIVAARGVLIDFGLI